MSGNDDAERWPAPTNVWAGAAAGAVGGLAGAAVKLLCERIAPPRTPDREPPPGVLAANIARAIDGRELTHEQQATIALAIHWTFSTVSGALYGAVVARAPYARFANGVGFGLVVWAGFHEFALPMLGATPPLRSVPAKEQMNEFVTHAIFGATVETVRAAALRGM